MRTDGTSLLQTAGGGEKGHGEDGEVGRRPREARRGGCRGGGDTEAEGKPPPGGSGLPAVDELTG